MKKTIFVLYEDEILTDTGGKQDIKTTIIGKYDTQEEARMIYREILNDKPEDVDIEIRLEKEEVEVQSDMMPVQYMPSLPEQTVEMLLFRLQQQMQQVTRLLNNQINIIHNLDTRIKELEKVKN